MSLQELKKEVHSLISAQAVVDKFKLHWLTPLHKKENFSFTAKGHKEVKELFKSATPLLEQLMLAEHINQKLKHSIKLLIDLKLARLRKDSAKEKQLLSHLFSYDNFNLKETLRDVKEFEKTLNTFTTKYHYINDCLDKLLPLEESVFFSNQPHKEDLTTLHHISSKQKELVSRIGSEVVLFLKP